MDSKNISESSKAISERYSERYSESNPLNEINPSKDFENMSYEEKKEREKRLLEKFHKEFKKVIMLDPVTHMIFSMLLRGADPYQVIEKLLVERHNTMKYLDTNVINNPIMIPE